jgi:hypothetical protein
MSGIFENTLCSIPFQGNYLATASATANALDLAQTAAFIEREGLRFDGTAGAVIGNGGIPAVGTGDFTAYAIFYPGSTNGDLISGSTNAFGLYYVGTILGVNKVYVSGGVSCTITLTEKTFIAYVRSAGMAQWYVNGAAYGTAQADTNSYSAASTTLMARGDGSALSSGSLTRSGFANYALTQSEITALIGRGLVTLPEQRGGSMTALNTSAWTALNSTQSLNTATAQTFTANPTAGAVGTTITVIGGRPKRYRFSVTHAGIASGYSLSALESNPNYGANEQIFSLPTSAGSYSFEYQTNTDTTSVEFRVQHAGSGISTAFTGISIIPLGTLFEQDSGQRNAGYMVRDTSGNNADLILPATGVSVIDPAQRGTIRFTTNISGNQQIGGSQVIIPTNARISSWVINANGTPNVTLGNVSGGAQYRASAAVVAGGNQITLLTPFTPTGNLWCNSSTTATLKHTIQWEYI